MRASESIQIGFSLAFAMLAWFRLLEIRRRLKIAILALIVLCAILLARFALPEHISSIVRDWLPAALLLFPYWQAGQFFTGPDFQIQNWLSSMDGRVMQSLTRLGWHRKNSILATYFESAYLMCYPLVPIGLGVLYIGHHRALADFYWVVVVLASDICFAATIFVPAMPPRLNRELEAAPAGGAMGATNDVRKLNLEVLNRGSIQAITFPSAHVASTMAAALVLLRFQLAAGALFLAVAISIALGAFLGRYHYLLDVVLGAADALIVFLACLWVIQP